MSIRKILIGIQGFNAFTAMAGGLGLMVGWIDPGDKYLMYTDFPSYFFPGVILLCLVGGSALLAFLAVYFRVIGSEIISLIAGFFMLFWIIGEVAAIREFHFLQAVYLVTSLVVIYISLKIKDNRLTE